MTCILVRVGADLSSGGGFWNAPVDSATSDFVYVAIPEASPVHAGLEKPYERLTSPLAEFNVALPNHLKSQQMHLDPDFEHLTYGDTGQKAKQLKDNLRTDDIVCFYAGLRDVHDSPRLIYAIIGLFVVAEIVHVASIPPNLWDINAHSRRILGPDVSDVVIRGRPGVSGRLRRCLPIGEYRNRAYRVRKDLLDNWGGLSVKDGYLQRSARLPRLLEPDRFLTWLHHQDPSLIQANN